MIELVGENKRIVLEYSDIMQLAVMDINLANEIFDFMESYFQKDIKESNGKYKFYDIVKDKESVSKSRYEFVGINSYKDIDKLLEVKKASILERYNQYYLDNIEIENEIMALEEKYVALIEAIKKQYKLNSDIKISYNNIRKEIFSYKDLDFEFDETDGSWNKLKTIMQILSYLAEKTGKDYLFYLNHVETYLTKSEVKEMLVLMKECRSIFFVIGTGNSEYLDYKSVEKINFIYDSRCIHLSDLLAIQKKVNSCICCDKHLELSDIVSFLKRHSFEVVEENYKEKDADSKIFNAIMSKAFNVNKETEWELVNTIII